MRRVKDGHPLRRVVNHDATTLFQGVKIPAVELECGHKLAPPEDRSGRRYPERMRCRFCAAELKGGSSGGSEPLTEAQRRILRDAARDMDGERTCRIYAGGAAPAKALEALGLGTYYRRTQRGSRFNLEVSPARFVINDTGIDALDDLIGASDAR